MQKGLNNGLMYSIILVSFSLFLEWGIVSFHFSTQLWGDLYLTVGL